MNSQDNKNYIQGCAAWCPGFKLYSYKLPNGQDKSNNQSKPVNFMKNDNIQTVCKK